jgi:hypothetical protein
MIQAIGRLRLIHVKKPRRSTSCANIPLDIPVDELVMWKQLIGDRRLNDALAERDERGWDALPLVAKEMPRLFPHLWATKKSAERRNAKNPPEPHRDIIRICSPPARSEELARCGTGPMGAALAGALGVGVRDIGVRGTPSAH